MSLYQFFTRNDARDELLIGRIMKPWGVKGEVKAVLTEITGEMFVSVDKVTFSGNAGTFNITSKKFRHDCVILKFEGIDSPEDAVRFNGMTIECEGVETPPLEEGQYYIEDIIGLEVITDSGEKLGKVSDVQSFPANDVYVMDYKGKECLIPAIDDIIKEINTAEGYMKIQLMEGLLE